MPPSGGNESSIICSHFTNYVSCYVSVCLLYPNLPLFSRNKISNMCWALYLCTTSVDNENACDERELIPVISLDLRLETQNFNGILYNNIVIFLCNFKVKYASILEKIAIKEGYPCWKWRWNLLLLRCIFMKYKKLKTSHLQLYTCTEDIL